MTRTPCVFLWIEAASLCTIVHMETPSERIRNYITQAVAESGVGVRRYEAEHGLPRWALRGVMDLSRRQSPSVDRAAEICEALGLEFYIGPPRTGADLYSESPAPYDVALPHTDLDRLQANVMALLRMIAGMGGKPAPVDLRDTGFRPHELTTLRPQLDAYDLVPRYDVWLAPDHDMGETVEQASEAGYELFRRQWLRRQGLEGDALCVVDVVGNSMAPTLCDGDWTLVDRSQRQLRHGGIFALSGAPVPLLRRIREAADVWWADCDNNSGGYDPLALSQRDEVIGRVVWWAHTEE